MKTKTVQKKFLYTEKDIRWTHGPQVGCAIRQFDQLILTAIPSQGPKTYQ